ncbi:MAG: NYN domain-containing protein [Armatimonadetes bacterium]|nr:NYN domain-containing protein [Armatimonadota bacterium]
MENRVAVFVDFENIKRAVDDYFVNERVELRRIFEEIGKVTDGRIILKRAYADWGVFKDYRSDLLDNACDPIQTFALTYKGKNGADIKIAIDVMDVALRQNDITHVALVSGDSDFTPLVLKLRETGRYVVGVGVRSNTSTYLAKACDRFCYYDDIHGANGEELPERSIPSTPMDTTALLAKGLATLGNRPVPGSALKTTMRKIDPMFDETRSGHTSFLDFLRAHGDLIDLHKPAIGDVMVAPKGHMESGSESAPVATNGTNGAGFASRPEPAAPRYLNSPPPMSPLPAAYSPVPVYTTATPAQMSSSERLRLWLRDNNFRYVPTQERHEIIRVMYDLFADPANGDVSLKEAKDHLHLWFEENKPSVPWESINSTVYHLFYTWCFFFDRSDGDEGKQLWDRRTSLQPDIHSADELIAKCERGVARKLWERDRGDVDVDALNDWLYDGDAAQYLRMEEMVKTVGSSMATGGNGNGGNGNGLGANGYPMIGVRTLAD